MRFGKLVAASEAEPKLRKDRPGSSIRRMECLCDCGNKTFATVPDLKSGNTKSCGCHKIEATKAANTTHGATRGVSRGGPASPEYRTWFAMISRCEYAKNISYEYYGARGIKVCERWRNSFPDFLADMGEKPSADHSIDRIDVNGNYSPENCRWSTGKEQFANQRQSAEFLRHVNRGGR